MIWTAEQRAVIDTRDAPVLVAAGPGSGKTRTLVGKFLALTREGVAPERILALTFSTKAAAEIQHRLEEATRQSHPGLWISTFHSFGYALVDRFRSQARLPRAFRLLTGFKEWVLLRDVLQQVAPTSALRTAARHRGLVSHVAGAIGALKQGLVSPDALARTTVPAADAALVADLAAIYRAYEAALDDRRHFDYRDLIWHAHRLLTDDAVVRRRVQDWFDAILLDELQDIDPAQLGLVRALAQGSPLARRVTAFGDTHQSIYGFRGALPQDIVASFAAAFPGTRQLPLTTNFRAHPALVAVARRVIPSAMTPDQPADDRAPIEVLEAPTSLAEATAIARALSRAHRDGTAWRDMAILCRSLKRDARAIESELQRLDIPYRVQGNASFYRNPAVAFLVNYLLALAADKDDPDDGPLRRVLASPIAQLPQIALARFLDRVVRRQRHAGRYLWYLRFLMEREDADAYPVWRPDQTDQTEADAEVDRERTRYEPSRPPYFFQLMTADDRQAFYDFHQTFLFLRARARKAKDALPALLAAVATRSGLTPWILRLAETNSRLAERHAANITKLQRMVGEFAEIAREATGQPPTLADLAAHLRQLLEHFAGESEVDAPAEAFYDDEDAVQVMTVHQAKGLEFDVVAVPHLVVGRFPSPPRPGLILSADAARALEAAHALYRDPTRADAAAHFDEERRLAYVALTRARRRAILSWAHRYDGEESESAPSPYLVEALGGTERTFWDTVHDRGIAPGQALAELADAQPDIDYTSADDELALDDLRSLDEADVALRRLYQRGDQTVRDLLTETRARHDIGLDWDFVSGSEPFPAEPDRPIALPADRLVLSASRLADYQSCPRKFYYAKLLHLEPWTRSWAVFGTLVHDVLEHFHRDRPDKRALTAATRPAWRQTLLDALTTALQQRADQLGSDFELQRQLAGLGPLVDRYLDLQAEEPLRYVSACELVLEFATASGARMIAKIDRVVSDTPDLADATEVLIADYKTVRSPHGKARSLAKRIREGRDIQLATYHRALRLADTAQHADYLSLIYLRHQSDWRQGTLAPVLRVMPKADAKADPIWWGLDSKRWTDRAFIEPDALDDAWDRIETLVREILAPTRQTFDITPGAHCRYCDFAAICGKE